MSSVTIHNLTNGGVWGGAATAFIGSLTLTEWMTVGGFLLAIASFVVNAVHKRKMLKERRREVDIQEKKAGLR